MADPRDYGYDPDDFGALADWDNGEYHWHMRDDGHITVYGTIDGEHYHISWEARDGSGLHSTLGKGELHNWRCDHDKDF